MQVPKFQPVNERKLRVRLKIPQQEEEAAANLLVIRMIKLGIGSAVVELGQKESVMYVGHPSSRVPARNCSPKPTCAPLPRELMRTHGLHLPRAERAPHYLFAVGPAAMLVENNISTCVRSRV